MDIYTDTEYNVTMLAVLAEHRGFAIRKMPLKFGTGGLKMTIDEAIKHCLEVAEQNDTQAKKWKKEGGEQWGKTTVCRECAADHRQLAEWLMELKDLREENKVLISECDRLIKEKGKLLNKVSGGDVLRICQLEDQLEKTKRLLKAAVEDFTAIAEVHAAATPILCPKHYEAYMEAIDVRTRKWRYADEALKLINS